MRSIARCRVPAAIILVIVAAAAAPAVAGQQPEALDTLRPGDWAWRIRAPHADAVALDAFRDRPLFINVWATWCAPCVAEIESIRRLADSVADTDVVFLLVSPEQADVVAEWSRRRSPGLTLYVEQTRMPPGFGLRAVPTTWVVDREGRVVLRHRGAAEWDDAGVRALLRWLDRQPATRLPARP